jgi:secreted Zn-dependent insulinase-like peptidase
VDDLGTFVPRMLGDIHIVALSHGDVRREEALRLVAILENTLLDGARSVEVPRGKIVKLAPDSGLVRQLPVDHHDSALAVYFQGDDTSFASRARFGLMGQILARSFFHELRTERQLGYVVFASPMPLLQVPGLVFVVQSPDTDPAALSAHVEDFLESQTKQILTMPDAVFDEHKRGLITLILEKEKNLQERSDRYWIELDNERYEFDSRERLAAAVEAISKEDLAAFYRQALLGQERKQLSVQAVGRAHHDTLVGGESESAPPLIVDSRRFKRGQSFFPG